MVVASAVRMGQGRYWFVPEQRFLWARTSIDLLPEPLLRRKCAFTDDGRDEIGKKIYYMRESKLEMKRKKMSSFFVTISLFRSEQEPSWFS